MTILTPGSTTAQRPPKPTDCRDLGGCLGDERCLYCDEPMPPEHVMRRVLEELQRALRGMT